jgi:DNA-binding Lrp family transcriptional regulator
MDDLGVPRATDLTLGQIAAARAAARDDIEAAARALRVSSSALKRRLAALEAKG